ncbi:MAG: YigZ family protein [Candidatus Marinimicrobia bacterium]|nr:YigZ family protein [Candidatus Neomarinimicrobiota bacterium]
MKFQTISKPSKSKFTEKGSKFLGFAFPVGDKASIDTLLHDIRKTYYDATHHCYAWQLGYGKNMTFRYNDDGEPSGTAGKPIYNAITRLDLTNVLVLSVRYFGGTKLGTGGLIRAYGTSASNTLAAAVIKTVEHGDKIRFVCSYEHHPIIMRTINQYHIISLDQEFAENVSVDVEIDEKNTEHVLQDVKNVTNGGVLGKILNTC